MFQDVSVMPMVHMFLFYLAGLTAGVEQHGGTWEEIPPPRIETGSRETPTTEGWSGPRQPSPLSS
jgi:hypothetical protein